MINHTGAVNIHYWLMLLLAVLLPSGFYKLGGILVAILFLSWLFLVKGFREIRKADTPVLLSISFFLIILVGFVYTNDISNQIQYTSRKLAFLIIPLVFIGFTPGVEQLNKIKKYFVYATLIFILIADLYALADYLYTGEIKVFLSKSNHNKFTYYGLTRVFSKWHPTYVSLFLNTALIFIYEFYYHKKNYIIWLGLSLFAILNILLLTSFIGIVSLLFLTALFVYKLLSKNSVVLIMVSAVLVLTIGFLYVYNPLNYSKINKFKKTEIKITDRKVERNVLNLRLAKWKTSLQVIAAHPVFGVTNGDYKEELYQQYLKNDFRYCASKRYSSHNQYLYTATSNGLIGFLLLLGILIVPFFRKGNIKGLFPFLGIMSIYFLTEDVLARQQGVVFFIFFYILLTRNKIPDAGVSNEQ